MPRRTGDPISLHWRGGLPLYVLLSLLYVALVSAQYNVTVGANNALLEYQPYEAWEKITDQVLGDGTARVTRQKGARVSLSFTGTGVYFQTTRAQGRGISTIDLDGETFKVDSSLTRTDGEDRGILWGILSLKEEKHVITVTQSADEGTELAVNAFVYITSKAPPPLPTLTPTSKARPGPLDTDNPYFSRNLALVLVSIGLTLVLFILSIWIIIIRRRRRKLGIHANGIIDKSNIRLAMTPTSDTSWMLRKSYTSSAQAPSINNTEDSSSIIKTPNSAAFLIRHSRKDSFSKSTTIPDRTYSPSSLSSSATTKQIPRDFLIRNPEISAATPQRPKFVLPTFNLDLLTSTNTTNTRGPSSRVTMTSLESISHNFPATSASSVLEHDGIISITPRMSLDGNDDDDDETRSQGPQSPRSSVLWRSHHRMVRDCSETAPSRGR